ncbi:class I SAM-dependent methyltransferase [Tichowtungia aerotolerans]|uniref:Methyltransferase domain-containing protein n=1 Tax=Tichowtungia aerotolerans TaxID=2697043 RepID=A0A6P1MAL4_9BACT|nr:methyltransferase domain-containing protein [Tichowtungia aerotolerans]QHI69594.1 methyltransferase domain-containing protein [Tichowtungia aerotolerans]
MHKKQHPRSAVARQTEGITLDHAAPVYDLLAPIMTLGLERRFHRMVIRQLALRGDEQVLDIGCGTGTLTRDIAAALSDKTNSCCTGLDAAEKMIAAARKKAAGIRNIQFDAAIAERLPYADRTFDAAVSTFFFHHIHFELKKKVLAETARVLKPGGRMMIVDVDIPTSLFGTLCARSGHWLFQQNEIAENIEGRLRDAMDKSSFSWRAVSHHSGYITVFELNKEESL